MSASRRLYHYWRSTSSWRVRWGFEAKGLHPELVAVDLLSGENDSPEHLRRNPMGYVPVLELCGQDTPSGGFTRYLGESTAILEWLEETHPSPALLPKDPLAKARVRMLCEIINAGTQPLGNLSVTEYLSDEYCNGDKETRKTWSQHWIRKGLSAYETLVQETAGRFSFGDDLTLADIYLIPQCYAAIRNDMALSEFPTIERIHRVALELPSCQASHPDRFKP